MPILASPPSILLTNRMVIGMLLACSANSHSSVQKAAASVKALMSLFTQRFRHHTRLKYGAAKEKQEVTRTEVYMDGNF